MLDHARAEAGAKRPGDVGTAHLLLGILREGSSLGARALRAAGATLPSLRSALEAVGDTTDRLGALAVSRALLVGKMLGGTETEPEHLLLCLLAKEPSPAVTVLLRAGIAPDRVRREVFRLLATEPSA